jgi:hypothetical protein
MSVPTFSGGRWHRISLAALAAIVAVGASSARAQTAAEVAAANNPLAPITAINLQDYYVPTISGSPDSTANSMLLRGVLGTGSMIIRATLPLSTVSGSGIDASGLGDLNVFDAFLLPRKGTTQFGVGPLFVFPTATNDALGAGKWQAGAAVVFVTTPVPELLLGSLVTYQHSFANAGSTERSTTSLLIAQPLLIAQVGGGWYLRSTAVWTFDLEQGTWNIPLGIGAGKVLRAGHAVLNIFLEPQFTAVHYGAGQPALQIFGGINIQFPKQRG